MAKGTPNKGINGTLVNGLLAHYSFNDGSLADLSGNGYDLTQVGTVNNTTDKDGQENQAKENLTTTESYLQCETKYLTNGTNNAVSMWVYIPNLTQNGAFFSIENAYTATSPQFLLVQNNNFLRIYAGLSYSSSIEITTGWHNITYNNNKLYIDKQLKTVHNILNINTFLYLFNSCSPTGILCKLDEVRVYNRLLTGDTTIIGETATGEIAELYDMGVNYQSDIEPPTFNTVNISNTTPNSIDLTINCNENATAYYKLYDRNATAPTPDELKTTHDGIIALTANNLITKSITGLTASKDYDLYVVAEDTMGNLQNVITKIDFKTLPLGKLEISSDYIDGIYDHSCKINLSVSESVGTLIKFSKINLFTEKEWTILEGNSITIEESGSYAFLAENESFESSEELLLNINIRKALPYIDINEKKEVNLYNEKYVISTRPIQDIIVTDRLGNNIKSLDFFSFSNSYLTGMYIYKIKENLKNINFENIYFLQKDSEVPFCSLGFYDFKTIIINSSEANYSGDEAIKISKILETLLKEVLCFNCNYKTEERFEKIIKNCPTDLILKIKGENFFNIVNFKLYLNNFLKIISRRSDNIFVENIKKEFFIFKDDIEFDVFCFNCKNKDEISEASKEQSFLYLNKIKKFIEEEMQQLSCVEFKGEM